MPCPAPGAPSVFVATTAHPIDGPQRTKLEAHDAEAPEAEVQIREPGSAYHGGEDIEMDKEEVQGDRRKAEEDIEDAPHKSQAME